MGDRQFAGAPEGGVLLGGQETPGFSAVVPWLGASPFLPTHQLKLTNVITIQYMCLVVSYQVPSGKGTELQTREQPRRPSERCKPSTPLTAGSQGALPLLSHSSWARGNLIIEKRQITPSLYSAQQHINLCIVGQVVKAPLYATILLALFNLLQTSRVSHFMESRIETVMQLPWFWDLLPDLRALKPLPNHFSSSG